MKGLILNLEFHEMGPSETLKSLDCVGVGAQVETSDLNVIFVEF